MNIEEHIRQVIRTMSEGDELVNEAKPQGSEDKEDKKMAVKKEGFDPGVYNKAWVAALGTFGSQWGINFNESINQVVMNPPENILQAFLMTGIVSGLVAYVTNRKK